MAGEIGLKIKNKIVFSRRFDFYRSVEAVRRVTGVRRIEAREPVKFYTCTQYSKTGRVLYYLLSAPLLALLRGAVTSCSYVEHTAAGSAYIELGFS